jgi:predicted HicB family RNase H-like nuclease
MTFPPQEATSMQNEYDFSNAERGKFHRANAVLQAPIYLDPELRERLAAHAKAKGISIDQLANELLKRELDLMESAK